MIKVTFDGNNTNGFTILVEIPYDILVHKPDNAGKCLFCDESPDGMRKGELLVWVKNQIYFVEEVNIFEHELVVIHTDTTFEPGPGKGEHFEELTDQSTLGVGAPVVQGFVNTPGDLVEGESKTTFFDPNHNMTSEQMLEEVAQGKIDISTLPISYSDEPQDSEDKD